MARARRRSRPSNSLFPFLSILACVIGVLALLITTSAVGQIATDAIDVEHYEKLEQQIADDRQRLAGLRALDEEVQTLTSQLEAARAERDALAEQATRSNATEETAALRHRLASFEERIATLRRELGLLEEATADRTEKLDDHERAVARAPVVVRPSGSGVGLQPHFVECRPEGIVLYGDPRRPPSRVAAIHIPTSDAYRGFVRRAKMRAGSTVIFLIRPGGVPVYDLAIRAVRDRQLRSGEIPIPGDGPLDLSAFSSDRGAS